MVIVNDLDLQEICRMFSLKCRDDHSSISKQTKGRDDGVKLCSVLSSQQFLYSYIWTLCRVLCQPTSTCTNMNQTFERSKFECCAGFQVRPATSPTHNDYITRFFNRVLPAVPVGCPRGVLKGGREGGREGERGGSGYFLYPFPLLTRT